jgi:error-prone DNA polymerase
MAAHSAALARSDEIADRCRFSLDELTYTYPTEAGEDGQTPQERLEELTWAGAEQRYPDGLPDKVAAQLRHELTLIERMGYAPYFLTVDSIVRFARGQGILCQGRGSAANSAVCYVLGITSIDPVRQGLLFERFISTSRDEPPDIDVDFEHERREEVIQWVFNTYGHHRAALTATVNRYGARGAVREVGKALGVPEDVTGALASLVWGWSRDGVQEQHAKELNLNLDDRRLRLTLDLAQQLIETPRHLGQHPGGFVLTLGRLDELCPIAPASMENRQTLEWDKIDIEVLKFMKVDVLGLGMLGCMRRAFALLATHKGISHDLATIPAEDEATYAMIRRADTIGVFQIESRAQMAMLPRMAPKTFYDLVIEVAVVRPGPIQGGMVHPYLRRREGHRARHLPDRGAAAGARANARCPALPRASHAGRDRGRRLHPRRGRPAPPRHGHVQVHGGRLEVPGQADPGHDRQRLRPSLCRAHVQAARRLRLLRLPREPRRLVRAHRLRLVLDEVPPPGRILLRDPQASPWAFTRRRSSCAMPSSTACPCGRST